MSSRRFARRPRAAVSEQGFTLLELLISMAILMVLTGAIFEMTAGSQASFGEVPRLADLLQRLRVAADAIGRDLQQAGSGLNRAPAAGNLVAYRPPIRPGRTGTVRPDPELVFAEDRITIQYAGAASPSDPNPEPERRIYYFDAARRQLRQYDGRASDMPIVDEVVGLRFAYFADPDPFSVPLPPPGSANCLYGAGDPPMPLLRALGGVSPRPVGAADLTDGPMCGSEPDRFDGDLLRITHVRVTLSVRLWGVAEGTALPAGDDSASGNRRLAEHQVSFDVAPRNLNRRR